MQNVDEESSAFFYNEIEGKKYGHQEKEIF